MFAHKAAEGKVSGACAAHPFTGRKNCQEERLCGSSSGAVGQTVPLGKFELKGCRIMIWIEMSKDENHGAVNGGLQIFFIELI